MKEGIGGEGTENHVVHDEFVHPAVPGYEDAH